MDSKHTKHRHTRGLAIAFAAMFAAVTNNATAALIFDVIESGGNVQMTMSGSINLSALGGSAGSFAGFSGYLASGGNIATAGSTDLFNVSILTWTPFGTGGFGTWDASSGDAVALFSDPVLGLPLGYVSGGVLSGTGTALGASFASLGFTPGSYDSVLTEGSFTDTVTVNIGPSSPVSEPATVLLLGLGLVALGARHRKS